MPDKRDSRDSRLNRLTLRIQYRLSKHIFVHTEKMKSELIEQFGGRGASITVIPFGINNTVPNTSLTPSDAKRRLGLGEHEKAILFFGNIRPYKGLEYLIAAFRQVLAMGESCRLIIVGRPSKCEEYWTTIRNEIREDVQSGQVLLKAEFIPDDEAEVYFKAADVLVLPYREIYQSGVLFTGYIFGLPVIAAEVGSLKDEIVEGRTGFVFRPEDPVDLAKAIQTLLCERPLCRPGESTRRDKRLRNGEAFLGRSWSDDEERICQLASNAAFRNLAKSWCAERFSRCGSFLIKGSGKCDHVL